MPSKEASGGLMRVLEKREAILRSVMLKDHRAKEGGGEGTGGHSGDQAPCSLL